MSDEIGQGFGKVLADARTAKGLTVAEVAEKLKLTPRQIEALEAEDLEHLPAAVFVRGFARNYARLLNLPQEALSGVAEQPIEPTATITAPSEGVVFRTSPVRRWLVLPLVGVVLFLAVVAALYSWLRQGEDAYLTGGEQISVVTPPKPTAQSVPVTPVQAAPASQPAMPMAQPPAVAQPPAEVASVASAAAPQTASPATANVPENRPAAPQSFDYRAGSGVGHTVHLSVRDEDSWIEVVSADDRHYSRLLRPGEQLTVRGVPPFKLIVGNAQHVSLVYDNKDVDLGPHTSNNVARLTLE
jgi:cytoskeleton protein RodZ